MMMNTNCIDCIDVQNPVKISQALVKYRQWAESDAAYLRMISARSSRDGAGGGGGGGPVVDRYACRQRFLRSYKFSQEEETVAQRTKKWFRAKRSGTVQSTPKKAGKNESRDQKKKKKKRNGDGSCSFLEAVFNFLFLCVAKVDVDDVVLRTRPAKA
ncbi:hypothetical protein BT93_H1126 [Corymbia citriodora subsp. variegata]|nr:hypothetical protein BT93_H1126 [Corymbia citriodora subsp. variegata]